MLSIFIATFSSFLSEASSSLGKFAIKHKWEHRSVMGLMNSLWTLGYFVLIVIFAPSSFVIVPSSIFLLVIAALLGVLQTIATLTAVQRASRSTFGLIRTLTIPIIAIFDALLGTPISAVKFGAMALMFLSAAWLYRNHGFSREGSLITLFTAVNAAVTISLAKIILNSGTSVAAAEMVFIGASIAVLIPWARKHSSVQKVKLHARLLTMQSLAYGLAGFIGSYALLFAPASVVTAASRSADVLWSIIFGKTVFHERGLREKAIAGTAITVGLCILAFAP